MNIFEQLKNNDSLSHNEKEIANYILEHPHIILSMNSKQLCNECFVSQATVYRLCDKLNISGFQELKVLLSSCINDYDKSSKKSEQYKILNKVKHNYYQALEISADLLDINILKKIAKAINDTTTIDLYSTKDNLSFVRYFKNKLKNKTVHTPSEKKDQSFLAITSNYKHLAIIISNDNDDFLINKLPAILKNQHTLIVFISPSNIECKYADYNLLLNNDIRIEYNYISLAYILDVLLVLLDEQCDI